MIPYRSTPVPNIVFDHYMRILKPTELTLLLVVIRQTIGWYDPQSQRRKSRDWLSGSQLRLKTGYSRKSLSQALEQLVKHQLIRVYDSGGKELPTAIERKGKVRLYYALHLPSQEERQAQYYAALNTTCVKSAQDLRTFYSEQKKLLQKKMTLSL